jgi:hypothetical protein
MTAGASYYQAACDSSLLHAQIVAQLHLRLMLVVFLACVSQADRDCTAFSEVAPACTVHIYAFGQLNST